MPQDQTQATAEPLSDERIEQIIEAWWNNDLKMKYSQLCRLTEAAVRASLEAATRPTDICPDCHGHTVLFCRRCAKTAGSVATRPSKDAAAEALENILAYVRGKDDLYANGAIRQFAEEGLAAASTASKDAADSPASDDSALGELFAWKRRALAAEEKLGGRAASTGGES